MSNSAASKGNSAASQGNSAASEGDAASQSSTAQSSTTYSAATTPSAQGSPTTTAVRQTGTPSTRAYGSLATFGHDASGGDRQAVLVAMQGYLGAIAAGNWTTACDLLSTPVKRQLELLLSHAKGLSGHGCAVALGALLGRTPVAVRLRQTPLSVTSVRTDGDHAFVLYRSALIPHASISMVREAGRWTAGVISAGDVG